MSTKIDYCDTLDAAFQIICDSGWRIHNLYQGDSQWEARIKHAKNDLVYGNGEGSTPNAALTAALAQGEARLNWRPSIPASRVTGSVSPRPQTTTDDLMKGLDL